MKKIIIGSALYLCALNVNAATNYTFIDLNEKFNGNVFVRDINNRGQMAGSISDGIDTFPTIFKGDNKIDLSIDGFPKVTLTAITESGVAAAGDYIWKHNNVHQVPIPGDIADINNSGQIVGAYSTGQGYQYHPFLWDGTEAIDLGTLRGGWAGNANAINDSGKVVGYSQGSLGNHAVLWDSDKKIDLGALPGGIKSQAYDINNKDQIIGETFFGYGHGKGWSATLWDDGDIINLGTLGGEHSTALAINNKGFVVGESDTPTDIWHNHAFIWDGHKMTDLNNLVDQSVLDAGWKLVSATEINDHGWIIGRAFNTINPEFTSFLLKPEQISPIPEPSTYAMLLAGLGLLGFVRRRKTK